MLLFKKKTQVPTKHQIINLWRSDWKVAGKISYSETKRIIKYFGEGGYIKTDSQFAKFIRDNLGVGIYLVLGWRKGFKGFWNFMMVEIREDCYRRLQRTTKNMSIKPQKKSCYPYLKSLKPVYSYHSYEEYNNPTKKQKEDEMRTW